VVCSSQTTLKPELKPSNGAQGSFRVPLLLKPIIQPNIQADDREVGICYAMVELRALKRKKKESEDDCDEGDANNGKMVASPQSRTRSSARQRSAPQRYGGGVDTDSSKAPRGNTAILTKPTRITRSTVAENISGKDTPSRTPTRVLRRRNKVEDATMGSPSSEESGSMAEPAPSEHLSKENEYDDVFDNELVAAQLQQDLSLHDPNREKRGAAFSTDPLPAYARKFQRLCQKGFQSELRALTKIVLEKLSGRRLVPLKGLQTEYQKVYQLIERTVVAGEGNSMLLLGSRGCGKTAVVESIISALSRKHKNDFHVVRLNGFFHTDDRLAVREIWRQLGRETDTEDEVTKTSSYADTMTTLLALLSHPEDLFGPSDVPGTIATAKSVVIVLDEFDLFAYHPRQALLYNLFDIAQARKAPLAVIGLTTKLDVAESLEKRVKSRFSHRHVFLSFPRTFETFSNICLAGLGLDDEELSEPPDSNGDATYIRERSMVLQSEEGRILMEGWRAYLKVRFCTFFFDSFLYHT
jgi:origin recognition complex subunit 4